MKENSLDLRILKSDLAKYQRYPFGYCFITNKVYIIKEFNYDCTKYRTIEDTILEESEANSLMFYNIFPFQDPTDTLYCKIFAATQMILYEYLKGFSKIKRYGMLDLNGNILTADMQPLNAYIIDIWNISPEEYFINTSEPYRKLHPELLHLYHPEFLV